MSKALDASIGAGSALRSTGTHHSRPFPKRAQAAKKGDEPDGKAAVPLSKLKDDAFRLLDRSKRSSMKFDRFLHSSTVLDAFLEQAIEFMRAVLKADGLLDARNTDEDDNVQPRAKPSKLASKPRSAEDEEACTRRLREMGSTYAQIILSESNYAQWRQEQVFYEAFYELAIAVVAIYFENKHDEKVEEELGRVFRTDAFNFTRKPSDAKSVILARDLYSLRYEGDTFANARILAALHPRQKENSVHRFVSARSPIISLMLPEEPMSPAATTPKSITKTKRSASKATGRSSVDTDGDADGADTKGHSRRGSASVVDDRGRRDTDMMAASTPGPLARTTDGNL